MTLAELVVAELVVAELVAKPGDCPVRASTLEEQTDVAQGHEPASDVLHVPAHLPK
jgi:hypothetical protein